MSKKTRLRIEQLEPRCCASVTPLSSMPEAQSSLYLDFDGHNEGQWGVYQVANSPPFSTPEAISRIWSAVSEDFSPFNLNVTTVESLDSSRSMRVVVGGSGQWSGTIAGGLSYINSFSGIQPSVSWVFSDNLGDDPKSIADAISHEAGHALGLVHQRIWDGDIKVSEYNTGFSSAAPIMGNSYQSPMSVWWNGTTTSEFTFQNDMEVIARQENGFGYREDDYADSQFSAAIHGGQFTVSGLIGGPHDTDVFGISASGPWTFTVTTAEFSNLDVVLELHNQSGFPLATGGLNAVISSNLEPGTYYLAVYGRKSDGQLMAGHYSLVAQQVVVTKTPNNNRIERARRLLASDFGISFSTRLKRLDVDYFRFHVPESVTSITITIDTRRLGGHRSTILAYDRSFKPLAASISQSQLASISIPRPASGTITLVVSGSGPGAYWLLARFWR